MEHRVNLPCAGELEAVHHGADYVFDSEGSFSFRGKLSTGILALQVTGFEPYLLTLLKGGEGPLGPSPVRLAIH